MTLWLLGPTARCSWQSFRNTPLSEVNDDTSADDELDPSQSDRQRVVQSKGFFKDWIVSIQYCYERTPLTGQEGYKTALLWLFVSSWLVTSVLAKLWERSRPGAR